MSGYDGCEGTRYTREDIGKLKESMAVLDAHGLFVEKCGHRLVAKSLDGFTGWDTLPLADLADRLISNLSHGDLVDAANFAMMLERRDGGGKAMAEAMDGDSQPMIKV